MGLDLDPGLLRGFPGLGLDPGEVDLQVGSRPATATGQTRSDNATDCGANAKVPSAPHSGSKVGGKPERPHVTLPGGASLQRCPSPSPKGPLTSLPPTPAPATPGLPATSSFGTEPSAAATGAVPVGTASAGPLGVRRGGPGAVSGGLGAHGFVTAASGQLATQPSAAGGSLVTLRSSESLGSILARHPGLVRAVRDPHPDAGLRPMRSILRQLGKKRLAQPRGRDMEWVFGLTGRAGTFVSMAPEVWSGLPYNEKADVFSFGIVMYELLARELLLISHFRTSLAAELRIQTPEDLAEAYTRGYRPARPRTLQGPSYDELWALITACWHDDPVQRPSMQEVAERLRQLRAQAADSAGLDGGPTDDAAATGANGAQQPRCAGCVVS
ncbi:hypothetical protein HYH03_017387 [Edaphochlamys debaryana]|uniref:Tyrosine-protein kinase catalytic domain-containing protein n=1 Tax=Edaphochlamys debaryana TaxID=47281 RepID=A0A836BPD0_9CHLO|nr:hypothetical protein HYH03_017387 [Edaphochlamys debaryana]|eukprot:KAG2483792.1 hypothetical protein HYH03_017387 [Edaphochlamys debaryana]